MLRKILLTALMSLSLTALFAGEGMWLPSLIGERIDDMRAKGFRLGAGDIYDERNPSMKDAIVKFGRGCTGELISPEGLMVTNHHCAYGQIQRLSSDRGEDFLRDGFWAMSREEEIPNPGLEVTFLVKMEDVTQGVLGGTSGLADGPVRDSIIRANATRIMAEAVEGTHYKAEVSSFYYGNQYYLFVNEVFSDVRLVGAPPSSIGKFGGDTDNWMWPRHTGDFALLRIYAGPDNKPSPYSRDNVPYVPRKYFPVSTRGVAEGDFTLVYGCPGSTQQFITSDAVDYVLNYSNPAKTELRTRRLAIIEEAWQGSDDVRIAYAAKHANIANSWKKWQGESLGLERLGTVAKKKALEEEFEQWAADRPEYRGLTARLSEQYEALKPEAYLRDYYNETLRAVELLAFASRLETLKPGETPPGWFDEFYADYRTEVDAEAARYLVGKYVTEFKNIDRPDFLHYLKPEDVDGFVDKLFADTRLTRREEVVSALADSISWAVFRQGDRAVSAARDSDRFYKESVAGPYSRRMAVITPMYRTWVRALGEYRADTGTAVDMFPDANLTLRVAYGRVEGYSPEDGVWHRHLSTLEGIKEKERLGRATDNSDYSLTAPVGELIHATDHGPWTVDGTVPVNFLASNHTTGGNSGSPVLNGDGELVGINFDRTWLSTMSDIEFDPVMCRNISLDVRYMLFVIDRLGGAGYLLGEMDLR